LYVILDSGSYKTYNEGGWGNCVVLRRRREYQRDDTRAWCEGTTQPNHGRHGRDAERKSFSVVKKQLPGEPQITRMKRIAQMSRNTISVEPKVRNLCVSVPSAVKKNSCQGNR
jgi:hypothetical protein